MTFTVNQKNRDSAKIKTLTEIINGRAVVPPRSETFKLFHLKSTEFPCVIEAQELTQNVFIPMAIAQSEHCWLRVLNVDENIKIVNTESVKTSRIENFDIFKTNQDIKSNLRINELKNLLAKAIPNHVKDRMLPLCLEFADIFHVEGDKPTTNNFYVQKLNLKDNTPVYVKNYRLPQSQKQEINEQVAKLLKQDLIEMSTSSYNSPLIVVPKKSTTGQRKWRMCVDYRLLNRKLVPDKFPLPRIDEILDGLGRAKYFSCLDLQAGYHQIKLDSNSRPMTSFSTERGFYQWKVLPFGINVAPASFTRMMTLAFSGLTPDQAFIYMDDLIVIGWSENKHIENLRMVFETCRKHNLKLNPLKCQFFRHEVHFLGHKCTSNGIMPDPSKLNVVEKYPIPRDKAETKRFVAFANYYRRFVRNFLGLARPLNALTAKKKSLIWSDECQKSFETIKKSLLTAPVLAYPDFSQNCRFKVTVDSSNFATGAVLSQDIDGIDRPITFMSRTFKKGEINKPIIEKELIAIHFALTVLRPYLYGREFTVFSDHKPLIYLYKLKSPSSKLTRIRLDLEEYKFDIVHIRGKDNVVADALSRIQIDELKNQYEHEILVITRSMTKNKSSKNDSEIEAHRSTKAFEVLQGGFNKKIPRIKTAHYAEKGNDVTHCAIEVHRNHRKVFSCEVRAQPNKKIHLRELLKSLEEKALKHNITTFQWPMYDKIFEKCPISKFKQLCNETLEKIKIHLNQKTENIVDETKRLEILSTFHNDILWRSLWPITHVCEH